jgi:hypothetical protein
MAAIILDGLACVGPLVNLAQRVLPVGDEIETEPWNGLPSVALHVAAVAVLLWAIGEIAFYHRLPIRRPLLIQFGIYCLGAAVWFFATAESAAYNIFVIVGLLAQFALIYPIMQIRAMLASINS